MKLHVLKSVEIEAAAIRCEMHVDDEEESIPNDFPGRSGETLTLTLDLNERKVRNWPGGVREVHIKVVDRGNYFLLDAEGNEIGKREESYVPDCLPQKFPDCLPQKYGDYFIAAIGNDGAIEGWRPRDIDVALAFFPIE